MFWVDTSADPLWSWKFYTGSVWITVMAIDTTNSVTRMVLQGAANTPGGLPTLAQVQNNDLVWAITSGSANAYVFDLGAGLRPVALQAGQEFLAQLNFANTGACTLNVTGSGGALGAISIKLPGGTDPSSGQLPSGYQAVFRYDGTNMVFLNPPLGSTALLGYASDTGSANAYAVAPSPAIATYAAGQIVTLKPGNANTTSSTLNVNALGTKNIKLLDGTNPAANALLTTGVYILVYDGTNFVVGNPSQPNFVGDSGSGGTKGLVPAPASGDAAAGKYLSAGGGFSVPANQSKMILLDTQTASASSTLQFLSDISSSYDEYLIVVKDLVCPTIGGGANNLNMKYSTNNGSTFINTHMAFFMEYLALTNGTSPFAIALSGTGVQGVSATLTNSGAAGDTFTGSFRMTVGSGITIIRGETAGTGINAGITRNTIRIYDAVNAIEFFSGSTMTSGSILLYGIKNT